MPGTWAGKTLETRGFPAIATSMWSLQHGAFMVVDISLGGPGLPGYVAPRETAETQPRKSRNDHFCAFSSP